METFEIRIAKYTYTQEQIDFVKKCVSDFDPDEIIQFKNENNDSFFELKDAIMDYACKINNLDLFSFFVEELDAGLEKNWDFLITACTNNSIDIIKYLLSKNISITGLNNFPFFIACKNGCLDILKLFFEYNPICPQSNDNEFIIIAAQYNQFHVVEYLISLGADPFARQNFLIKSACEYNNVPLLQFFIDHDLSISKDLNYCINICIAFDYTEIIQFYLKKSLFNPTSENFSYFLTCIEVDNVNIFNLFFEYCYDHHINIPEERLQHFLSQSDAVKEDSLCSLYLREKLGLGFACQFPLDFPVPVECHVCLEDSNLILPCRHAICSRCLILLYKTKTCGVCRLPFSKQFIKRK